MKIVLIGFFLTTFFSVQAQYYFNDIVSHQRSKEQYILLKQEKIKQVKAISYNDNNEVDESFNIVQKIDKEAETIVTTSSIKNQPNTVLTNNYVNDNLISSVTNNGKIEVKTKYMYSTKGLLTKVTIITGDTATESSLTEEHIWQYNNNKQPVQMLRITNKVDTLLVLFEYNDKSYVKEERWKRNGKFFENYFYYYDDNNMLTDVVRFNVKLRQFIPDYIYEFNSNKQLISATQMFKGGSDYLVWKYAYNNKGLKITETCFTKQQQVIGKIEYSYK